MFTTVLLDILGPILLMVALGAVMRWKFDVDMPTLTRLNLYLFSPAFIFDKVAHSTLPFDKMGGVVALSVIQVVTLGVLIWGGAQAARLLGFRPSRSFLATVALTVMFYNSGNYGLPLADLAYPSNDKSGGEVQAFVTMVQNVLTFSVGMVLAAVSGMTGGESVTRAILKVVRLPTFPALAAALVCGWWLRQDPANHLPVLIDKPARYLSDGMVPIALVTLGAQLATKPRWPDWRRVGPIVAMRLLFGPIQMAGLLWGFHVLGLPGLDLWPWPAELLILTAGTPTAVGTLLLSLEMKGDSETVADCVFWTTIFSSVTIAIWLIVLRVWFGG